MPVRESDFPFLPKRVLLGASCFRFLPPYFAQRPKALPPFSPVSGTGAGHRRGPGILSRFPSAGRDSRIRRRCRFQSRSPSSPHAYVFYLHASLRMHVYLSLYNRRHSEIHMTKLVLTSEMQTVPDSNHSSGLPGCGLAVACLKLWDGSGLPRGAGCLFLMAFFSRFSRKRNPY